MILTGISLVRAQEPEAVWPASNSESEGVLWYWGTQDLTGEVVDADGGWVRQGEALFRHAARPTWFGGVSPHKGFVEAADVGPAIARALEAKPRFHLEAVVYPASDGSRPDPLFWLGTYDGDLIWQVRVREGALWIEGADREPLRVGAFKLEAPTHFALTLEDQELVVHLNGEKEVTRKAEALPTFEDPWDVIAAFGGSPNMEKAWTGALEYLWIGTDPKAVSRHAEAWNAAQRKRTPPKTHRVTAKLVAHADELDEDDLSEYGDVLMGMIWNIQDGEAGEAAGGDSIFTWHFYALDGGIPEPSRPPKVGATRRLVISPASKHPQLEGIQQFVEGLDPETYLLLPEFFIPDMHRISDAE